MVAGACREGGESPQQIFPIPPGACSHAPEDGGPWNTLEVLYQMVLVQDTTQLFCPANTALIPGLLITSSGLFQAPDSGSQTLTDRQEPLKH